MVVNTILCALLLFGLPNSAEAIGQIHFRCLKFGHWRCICLLFFLLADATICPNMRGPHRCAQITGSAGRTPALFRKARWVEPANRSQTRSARARMS